MRLGDLDALAEKLKNGLENARNAGTGNYAKVFEVFISWVNREPTISAVPVVRCRECKHYKPEEYFSPCVLPQGLECAKPDDYCSYGQRKEADHEVSEP